MGELSCGKTVLLLNDDCLESVFDYLDEKSKFNFCFVCERFCSIFAQWSQRRNYLNEIDDCTLNAFCNKESTKKKLLLEAIGENVTSCSFAHCSTDLSLVAEHCPNIVQIELRFGDSEAWTEDGLKALSLMQTLNSVKWTANCSYLSQTLTENLLLILKDLPKLRKVFLEVDLYDGKFLYCLKNIEQLGLRQCQNIPSLRFQEMCLAMDNLRVLDLDRLDAETISVLKQRCHKLKALTISNATDDALTMIADLPSLQCLSLEMHQKLPLQLFINLAEKKSQQLTTLFIGYHELELAEAVYVARLQALQRLECRTRNRECAHNLAQLLNLEYLDFDCPTAGNDGVFCIIRQCLKLRYLRTYSSQLKISFVFDVIKLLRQIQTERVKVPLELRWQFVNFHRNVFKSSEYQSAKDILILGD